MRTMEQFIIDAGLSMTCKRTDRNPYMTDPGMRHWRVRIKSQIGTMTITFSQGPAIAEDPTLEGVLDCLAADAAGYENADGFDDWCDEYGYDSDSRKAERIYKAIGKQVDKLKSLLGADYDALLWETERA